MVVFFRKRPPTPAPRPVPPCPALAPGVAAADWAAAVPGRTSGITTPSPDPAATSVPIAPATRPREAAAPAGARLSRGRDTGGGARAATSGPAPATKRAAAQ